MCIDCPPRRPRARLVHQVRPARLRPAADRVATSHAPLIVASRRVGPGAIAQETVAEGSKRVV